MKEKAIASNARRANPTNLNKKTAKDATLRLKATDESPPGKFISPWLARTNWTFQQIFVLFRCDLMAMDSQKRNCRVGTFKLGLCSPSEDEEHVGSCFSIF
jgi:hypothetical protein